MDSLTVLWLALLGRTHIGGHSVMKLSLGIPEMDRLLEGGLSEGTSIQLLGELGSSASSRLVVAIAIRLLIQR